MPRTGQSIGRGPRGVTLEAVADGVWLVRGGFPKRVMNVYLLEEDGGVTVFDAGIADMADGIAAAADRFGGVRRVVLGHAHEDHRGAAPALGAPVTCHVDEKVHAEAEATPYFDLDAIEKPLVRGLMRRLLPHWDGGPCRIDATLAEGDEVAGFRVVHIPGHAPGLIALWREEDRLALTSDAFYTLDTMRLSSPFGPPRLPHRAYNLDTEQARASIRKLAAMEPASAWPGHADPVIGKVRAKLERAANAG